MTVANEAEGRAEAPWRIAARGATEADTRDLGGLRHTMLDGEQMEGARRRVWERPMPTSSVKAP